MSLRPSRRGLLEAGEGPGEVPQMGLGEKGALVLFRRPGDGWKMLGIGNSQEPPCSGWRTLPTFTSDITALSVTLRCPVTIDIT